MREPVERGRYRGLSSVVPPVVVTVSFEVLKLLIGQLFVLVAVDKGFLGEGRNDPSVIRRVHSLCLVEVLPGLCPTCSKYRPYRAEWMGDSAYFCAFCCNYKGVWVFISYTESYQPPMDLQGNSSYSTPPL